MKKERDWEVWNHSEKYGRIHQKRANGELEIMECTKQCKSLINSVYKKNMNILDVGCSSGHYYKSIRELDQNINYTGIDVTENYINMAKEVWLNETNAKFEVGDIYNILYPNHSFDIVYCFNVILHLPDYKDPIKELLRVTKKYLFIRTLIGDYNDVLMEEAGMLDDGYSKLKCYHNTYSFKEVFNYIKEQGAFDIDLIKDEYEPNKINLKDKEFTYTDENGKQFYKGIPYNWGILKIERK